MRKNKMPNFLSVVLRSRIPRHFTQVLATVAVSLGPFAAGLGKGYTSPALASLKESKTSTFPVSAQEGSWIASLSLLGAIFGCLAGGILLEMGRKFSLLVVSLPFSAAWLLTVFAQSVQMMYCSSFIAGFCSATILLASQVYVSEISHPEIRGCLSAILKMAGHLGALCSTSLGAFLDWRELAGTAAIIPILLFLTLLLIPETPSFLLYHSKEIEATEALGWLRSSNEDDLTNEIETLRSNIRSKERRWIPRVGINLIKPLLITCGLMFFHKFSGVTVFNHYAVPIFQNVYNRSYYILPSYYENILNYNTSNISILNMNLSLISNDTNPIENSQLILYEYYPIMVFGRNLNPHGAAIVVIFLQLLGSMTSGLLIDTAGRLPLLIVSSLFISGSFFGFGLYNWLEVSLPPTESGFGPSLDWIPLTCVLFFTLFFSIGIGPISWLLVGELFPLEIRGFGGALCTSFSYACAFLAVKSYEDLKGWIGLYGAFWFYSAISIIGLFFVSYAVPETKGIELEEMHHTSNSSNQILSGDANAGTTSSLFQSNRNHCSHRSIPTKSCFRSSSSSKSNNIINNNENSLRNSSSNENIEENNDYSTIIESTFQTTPFTRYYPNNEDILMEMGIVPPPCYQTYHHPAQSSTNQYQQQYNLSNLPFHHFLPYHSHQQYPSATSV